MVTNSTNEYDKDCINFGLFSCDDNNELKFCGIFT